MVWSGTRRGSGWHSHSRRGGRVLPVIPAIAADGSVQEARVAIALAYCKSVADEPFDTDEPRLLRYPPGTATDTCGQKNAAAVAYSSCDAQGSRRAVGLIEPGKAMHGLVFGSEWASTLAFVVV